jgi:hypothetical protein
MHSFPASNDSAKMISERTKAGLARAKERGVKLGAARPGFAKQNRQGLRRGGRNSGKTRREKRRPLDEQVAHLLIDLWTAGHSYRIIAACAAESTGEKWDKKKVWRNLVSILGRTVIWRRSHHEPDYRFEETPFEEFMRCCREAMPELTEKAEEIMRQLASQERKRRGF